MSKYPLGMDDWGTKDHEELFKRFKKLAGPEWPMILISLFDMAVEKDYLRLEAPLRVIDNESGEQTGEAQFFGFHASDGWDEQSGPWYSFCTDRKGAVELGEAGVPHSIDFNVYVNVGPKGKRVMRKA